MDEFVVRGGLVYDGTGAPPAQADVWVRDGEIMAVGVDAGGSDIPAVDASGCVVTPGFVDIHRHCDAAPLRDADFGRVELAQGITCALAGNCGLAPVPLDVSRHGEFYEYIEPVVGKVPPHVCYNSYAGYVRALEQTELPLHLGFLAGIGAVRCAVKGFSAQPFTKRELEQAVALVDQAMEAGACGASWVSCTARNATRLHRNTMRCCARSPCVTGCCARISAAKGTVWWSRSGK